jgi:hypothetical protein
MRSRCPMRQMINKQEPEPNGLARDQPQVKQRPSIDARAGQDGLLADAELRNTLIPALDDLAAANGALERLRKCVRDAFPRAGPASPIRGHATNL